MDTGSFFAYPTTPTERSGPVVSFLEDSSDAEWDVLLSYVQTRHVRRGEVPFTEDDLDRSLYLLAAGRLWIRSRRSPPAAASAPAAVNELAFLDGGRCAITARAATDCELLRLSYEAFESLAAREPQLARKILLDLVRIVARGLRATG